MAVSGKYAYLADGEMGLRVIDVALPNHPVTVGDFDVTRESRCVAISGNIAYTADGFDFLLIDITDPTNPTMKGTLPGYDDQGYLKKVVASGLFAHVLDERHGWILIDATDPERLTGPPRRETEDIPNDLTIVQNLAYEVGALSSVVEGELQNNGRFSIYDLSDPSGPRLLGACETSGPAQGVAVRGANAYVTFNLEAVSGIDVIDIGNHFNPIRVGGYTNQAVSTIWHRSAITGNHLYVAASDGLHVLDISNPTRPRRVGGNSSFIAYGVTAYDNELYVPAGSDGLIILNKYTELRIGPAIVLSDGRLQLQLSGASGLGIRVQRSANLIDWEDWRTVTLDGTGCELIDETAASGQRFYRAVEDNSAATK